MKRGGIVCGALLLLAGVAPASGQEGGTLPQRAAADRVRPASRSVDEIRRVLERHKGALYATYDQALKRDPAIAGKVLLEFTIEPDGQVSQASLHSKEIVDADFLSALRSIVLGFKFSDQPVARMITTYPIDFLPH